MTKAKGAWAALIILSAIVEVVPCSPAVASINGESAAQSLANQIVAAANGANSPGATPANARAAMIAAALAVVTNSTLDSRTIIRAFDRAIDATAGNPAVQSAIKEAKAIYLRSLRHKKTAAELGLGGDPDANLGDPGNGGGSTSYRPD